MELILPSAGIALASALLATPLIRAMLLRTSVLDQPNDGHKAHAEPVPTLGGAAVVLGVVLAMLPPGVAPGWGAILYGACLAVFLVGALDDVLHLSPWHKLGAELLCGVVVCAAGMTLPAGPAWVAAPVTVLWLVACANGFNLTDGADGLAALTGAIAAAGLAAIAVTGGAGSLAVILIALAAALAGFLPYNFPRASIFLGDSGALPVGFLLGLCGVAWARQAPNWVAASAPLFVLALPLGETALSVVRRGLRGDPIFRADRRHIHHRLEQRGLAPLEVTLWCGAYSLMSAAAGLIVARNGVSPESAVAAAAFSVATVAGVRFLRYSELACAAEMLLHLRGPWPLAQQIRVAELRHSLELASEPEQRWNLIVDGMRELGFREVRLLDRTGLPLRQSAERRGSDAVWRLTVDLPDGEGTLEVERLPEDGAEALVSDALVHTLTRAFAHEAPAAAGAPQGRPAGERRPS